MTGLEQIGIAVFGLAALWMGLGNNVTARKWAPIVGLLGQPFWAVFAWKTGSWALAVLVPAYSAVYLRGVWVQWKVRS